MQLGKHACLFPSEIQPTNVPNCSKIKGRCTYMVLATLTNVCIELKTSPRKIGVYR